MIYINGRLLTFTFHFEDQISKRGIMLSWVEGVLSNPTDYQLSNSSGYFLYDGYISKIERTLRVVVDEESDMLVTAFLLD